MKKRLSLVLALVLVLSVFVGACNGSNADKKDTANSEEKVAVDTEKADVTEDASEGTAERPANAPETVVFRDTDVLKGKKIGCSIVYKGDEWCATLAEALETYGKYYGAEIVVEDGDLNDETQTKQIENMVAGGSDIIMIDPTTPDGTNEALMKAVNADIPIIIYDGYWTAGEQNAVTTVTWNQHYTGELIGEYFVDYIKENNPGEKVKVVELTNAVSTHCQERFEGLHGIFDKAAEEGIEIEVLNKYDSQGNRELAYNAITAVVEPYDYIISDVDNGAMGAVSALQATGNKDVKVLSMGAYGAEPFGLLHEKDPNYLACLNVDAWVLAQNVFDAAIGHFEGSDLPTRTDIELYVVDSDNVADFWDVE